MPYFGRKQENEAKNDRSHLGEDHIARVTRVST